MSEAIETPSAEESSDTPPAQGTTGTPPVEEPADSKTTKSIADVKLIGPAILLAIFLAKAYGVSGYSLTTTTALATSTPLSIAIGTVALYTYAFVAVTAVVSAVLFAAAFLKSYRARLRPLIPLTGTLTLATLDTPWVPAEVVTLRASVVTNPVTNATARKPVAFVMGDDNGWTSLLIADDRFLARVRAADITSREVCHYNNQFLGAEPLFERMAGKSYVAHDLACFRRTDQADRMSFLSRRSS